MLVPAGGLLHVIHTFEISTPEPFLMAFFFHGRDNVHKYIENLHCLPNIVGLIWFPHLKPRFHPRNDRLKEDK